MTDLFKKLEGSTNTEKKHSYYLILLFCFTLLSLIVVLLLPPIPQWLEYHQFADTREIWGIPNFWNVISNIPFCLIGIWGFLSLQRKFKKGDFTSWEETAPFIALFGGTFLIGLGSAYYHWAPDNASLVWDRMPMTVVATSMIGLALMERVNFKVGLWLLIPLILFGIWTVWHWGWTETQGRGDLRLYGFVQFYSIALLLAILYLFPKPQATLKAYIWLIVFYGIAKIFEFADSQVYKLGGIISGHTLKHLIAAISIYYLIIILEKIKFNRWLGC